MTILHPPLALRSLAPNRLQIHVVSHTHWDREWYHPLARFRQRLVALVDELLDSPPDAGRGFLLDGQAIVLEDYLAVRPERMAELSALLGQGTLEAGPWYVLADTLIPGGEALVRNLLAGRRVLARHRASAPPVLYCPDSFGHPAALPALAAGFGCDVVVLWRGYGGPNWPSGDTVRWVAPDGVRMLVHHLPPDGYEFGASLPVDSDAAAARWASLRDVLAPRATTGVVLLPNGADHHARQRELGRALAALTAAADAAPPADSSVEIRASSLRAFADALRAAATDDLPVIAGELRDSTGYTWALQGTFGTRAHQKRANAMVERHLLRHAEPWSALARFAGGPSRRSLVQHAWQALLAVHPHDTLCGCSLDAVSTEADARLAAAAAAADGIVEDAVLDLVGHDAERARETPDAWTPVVLVPNPAPRPRGGVAIVEVEEFLAHEPVGFGSAPGRPEQLSPRGTPRLIGAGPVQVLDRWVGRSRVESPRHYPDNDLVRVTRLAVFLEPVGGYEVASYRIGRGGGSRPLMPDPVVADATGIGNGRVSLRIEGRTIAITLADGRRIESCIDVEDAPDFGDLYTPSIREPVLIHPPTSLRITRRGRLMGEITARWRFPARVRGETATTVVARLSVLAGSDIVRVDVEGTNRGRDRRLRIRVATGIITDTAWADAAFGPVERTTDRPSPEPGAIEMLPPTAPLHRYVTLATDDAGATLFSDGLAEYEHLADGRIAVTLVRAVGELSRNDLPERPGHAGWPSATPLAQCRGPFEARLAVLHHGPRDVTGIDGIERAADEVLLPLTGRTLRAAVAPPLTRRGITLEGAGLACSAICESDDGRHLVLRCVNLTDEHVAGRWMVPAATNGATLARLDETPLEPLEVRNDAVEFTAAPRAIVTVLVPWPSPRD